MFDETTLLAASVPVLLLVTIIVFVVYKWRKGNLY